MKQLIVITHPHILPDESRLLTATLDAGADYLHMRKPEHSCSEVEALLQVIPAVYHSRIVLHDCYELSQQYGVGGIHLNARNSDTPRAPHVRLSRSCHSFDDIGQHKPECEYLFLSPIYDSISKVGYQAAFSHEALMQASEQGIIDNKVIALGGISPDNIDEVMQYGFGGVAIMGCLWQNPCIEYITSIVKQIKEKLSCYNL